MVQVKINEGILEGELVENELGGHFYSFKGIPYAEPPLGELRFKVYPIFKNNTITYTTSILFLYYNNKYILTFFWKP